MSTVPGPRCLALAAVLAVGITGCGVFPSGTGTFDRNLNVSGPVRLELTLGSGDARVTTGATGEVRIHGEFSVHTWPWENASERVSAIIQNPPIEQQGSLIRVGRRENSPQSAEINYKIVVPVETEMRAFTGSGDLEIQGLRGPLTVTSGSGDIAASDIAERAQVTAGSGDIKLTNIQGEAQLATGSGDLKLTKIQGEIRAHTGSGDCSLDEPGGSVALNTSSGDVNISGATGDLRLHTGSGEININGNPAPSSYWDLRTGSGDVALHIPSNSSFRLDARSSSGEIDTTIPIVVEGAGSKHELRARLGDGKARVEIETGSGNIALH